MFKFYAYYFEYMEGARSISHEVNGQWTDEFNTLAEAKTALMENNDGLGGFITEARIVFTLEQE